MRYKSCAKLFLVYESFPKEMIAKESLQNSDLWE